MKWWTQKPPGKYTYKVHYVQLWCFIFSIGEFTRVGPLSAQLSTDRNRKKEQKTYTNYQFIPSGILCMKLLFSNILYVYKRTHFPAIAGYGETNDKKNPNETLINRKRLDSSISSYNTNKCGFTYLCDAHIFVVTIFHRFLFTRATNKNKTYHNIVLTRVLEMSRF